jgi:hypothetical protein
LADKTRLLTGIRVKKKNIGHNQPAGAFDTGGFFAFPELL